MDPNKNKGNSSDSGYNIDKIIEKLLAVKGYIILY
jgi:hypothetical protein